MKKVILFLIFGCLILVAATGCGKSDENGIKKLKVDLEKYDLPCEDNNVCDELNNKMVQIESYEGYINNELYREIILTSNGDVYLYDSIKEKIFKTKGSTKMKHIDGTLDSGLNYANPLIYDDDKYYSIEEDGNIKEVSFGFEADKVISHDAEHALTLEKDGSLDSYVSCAEEYNGLPADKCPTDDTWVKFTAQSGTILDNKVKYANSKIILMEDGKMYPMIPSFSWDSKTLTYAPASWIGDTWAEEQINLENPTNIWYWSSDDSDSDGNLVVQTSDGVLYHNWGSIPNTRQFKTKLSVDEKVKNVLFTGGSYYFLIVGESNVYLAETDFNDNYNVIKLDSIKKYKNDIRSFYMDTGKVYVLLSDGNLYKAYEV